MKSEFRGISSSVECIAHYKAACTAVKRISIPFSELSGKWRVTYGVCIVILPLYNQQTLITIHLRCMDLSNAQGTRDLGNAHGMCT